MTSPANHRTFAAVLKAAIAGERCPMNGSFGVTSAGMTALAWAGQIRVEVFSRNYRVVTILTGEHAGKTTAPCPEPGAKPYVIVDQNGTSQRRRRYAPTASGNISLPRTDNGRELLSMIRKGQTA